MSPRDGELAEEDYWPSLCIDVNLVGRTFTATEELGVAAFMAGSLRHILLSPEFTRLPRLLKQKLKHLSFLMHITAKYDNFSLVYAQHCATLKLINSGVKSWLDEEYFSQLEGNMVICLEQELIKPDPATYEHLEQKADEDFPDAGPMRIEDFLSTSPASPLPPRKIKREKKKKLGRPAKIPKSERANGNNATPSVYCPECKKDIVLKGKMTLLKHISKHHGETFNCPHCDVSKTSEKWMQKHIDRVHADERETVILCSKCSHLSNSFLAHVQHLRTHTVLTCEVCKKTTTDADKFKKHMRNHEKANEEVCPYCGKIYKHMIAHLYQVHRKHEEMKCTLCDYTSARPGIVNQHFRRVHSKPGICSKCHKTVKDITKHEKRGDCVTPREERITYPCESCDKTFVQRHHLVRHIDNIHHKNRDWICSQCAYKTTTKFNLKIHVRRVHEGKQLKEECQFCGKQVFNIEFHLKAYHQEEIFSTTGLQINQGADDKVSPTSREEETTTSEQVPPPPPPVPVPNHQHTPGLQKTAISMEYQGTC